MHVERLDDGTLLYRSDEDHAEMLRDLRAKHGAKSLPHGSTRLQGCPRCSAYVDSLWESVGDASERTANLRRAVENTEETAGLCKSLGTEPPEESSALRMEKLFAESDEQQLRELLTECCPACGGRALDHLFVEDD